MENAGAEATFTLVLHVVDDAGRPVEGASVEIIENNTVAGACSWPCHDRKLASDAAGRVEIEGLRGALPFGERYFVSVCHPDHAEGMLDRPERLPRDGGVARARLVMITGHRIEGHLGAARAPEGKIAVSLEDPTIPGCHSVTRFAVIGADGSFHVTGLHPGRNSVHALAPGAAAVLCEIQVPLEGPLTLDLPAARRASGTVVGPDGAPLAGAQVTAEWEGGRGYREATTDDRGAFSFDGLPCDLRTEIAARRPDRSDDDSLGFAVLEPGAGDAELTFDAGRRGRLRGRLHDDRTGEPCLRETMVRAEAEGTRVLFRGLCEAGDGRFAIALPEGTYTLGFEAIAEDMVASAVMRGVAVAAGETREDLRVEVTAAFRVAVQVVDAETLAPIAGAAVTALPEDFWYRVYMGNTGADGVFTVEPAVEGPLRVRAEADGLARATTGWVNARRGMDPIVIRLPRRPLSP